MSSYKAGTHDNYKKNFITQTKLVLKQEFSKSRVKHEQYKHKIVTAYNEYTDYIASYFDTFDDKTDVTNEINDLRDKLRRCYDALKIKNALPSQLLDQVDIRELPKLDEPTDDSLSDLSTAPIASDPTNSPIVSDPNTPIVTEKVADEANKTESQLTLSTEILIGSPKEEKTPTVPKTLASGSGVNSNKSNNNIPLSQSNTQKIKMEAHSFIALCAKQLHNTYSGDPLELNAFINSINLLKTLGPTHLELLKTFVLTKLSGKALESIPANPADVDAIITALRENIKLDSSKVVEGKMMALKLDNAKTSEFTKEAEKLAESLQRSLIVEGIPQAKAKSMAVEKTVEMCRQTAKSNLVRSVMASTSFSDPQEVVAKFVVESATDIREKQIFKFSQFQQNANRGGYRNNNNFRGRGNQRQNQNRNFNNFNNQNNGQPWNNFRGNRRGRGRGRGRYNNYGNNFNQNNQNDRFTVRVASSENSQAPSGDRRVQEGQIVTFQRVNQN
ncbi:putative transcriptional regulator cudA [Sitodiplosis mosellana]|uniref:putative transcriptional regulator cudA n=1 Tax=Sitodiplosis mosellana TaxID=263140 RepID=UPI0024442910|nr:putative transcriptional regulator cudA [Sitodiplosis mosellana]